jgi:hypothetical protein
MLPGRYGALTIPNVAKKDRRVVCRPVGPVKERAEGAGAGSFASRQWAQSNHITVNRLRHTTRIVDQIFPEPAIAPTYECAARVGQGFNREGSQRIAALSARSLL